jgi:hypothetical protein
VVAADTDGMPVALIGANKYLSDLNRHESPHQDEQIPVCKEVAVPPSMTLKSTYSASETRRRSSVGIIQAIACSVETSMPPLPAMTSNAPPTLLSSFLTSYKELEGYRSGKPVVLDGKTLSIAAVTAVSRYGASVQLDGSPSIKNRVQRSRDVIEKKIQVSTFIFSPWDLAHAL